MFPKSHFGSTSNWSKNIAPYLLGNHNAVLSFLFSLLFCYSLFFVLDTDVYQPDFL